MNWASTTCQHCTKHGKKQILKVEKQMQDLINRLAFEGDHPATHAKYEKEARFVFYQSRNCGFDAKYVKYPMYSIYLKKNFIRNGSLKPRGIAGLSYLSQIPFQGNITILLAPRAWYFPGEEGKLFLIIVSNQQMTT